MITKLVIAGLLLAHGLIHASYLPLGRRQWRAVRRGRSSSTEAGS